MRSEGYSTWFCPSVTTFAKQVKKWHQPVQRYTGFIYKMAIIVEVPRSEVRTWKASEEANMQISTGDRVRLLCASWRHKKWQRRACVDSRLLSTTVASPCQTLRELPARDREYTHNSQTHQLAVPRMRISPRVWTLVLFIEMTGIMPMMERL